MNNSNKIYFWAIMSIVSFWAVCFILPFVYRLGSDEWFGFPLLVTSVIPFTYPVWMLASSIFPE